MKYIKKNVLKLNDDSKKRTDQMERLVKFIYDYYQLNHDEMFNTYRDIKCPFDYDDTDYIDKDGDYEYDEKYFHSNLVFVNHPERDGEYDYNVNPDFEIDSIKDDKFIKYIYSYLSTHSPDQLIIDKVKYINIENDSGMHKGIYGVRLLDWRLHFWKDYDLTIKKGEAGITMHDLIIAAYKIKSHKFDNDSEEVEYVDCNISNDNYRLQLNVGFLHGGYVMDRDDLKKWTVNDY